MGWVGVALVAASVLQASQQAPPAPSADAVTQTLVVAYSDGRTTEHLVRPRGAFWTPLFPRKPYAPGHDGLALTALQVEFHAAAEIQVQVSLKYGTPHQRTVSVSEFVLGSEPMRVVELEAYGVDPIVIAVKGFSPAPLVQPIVGSASPLVDVSVDLVESDIPIYKFTIRNRANRAVMAAQYLIFRDGEQVASGRIKTSRQTPIIAAAGEHSWTAPVGVGAKRGFDRFVVTGVLWDDGHVEGDAELKFSEDSSATGGAGQLRRVLSILADAIRDDDAREPRTLAQVRAAIDTLSIDAGASDSRVSLKASSHSDVAPDPYIAALGRQHVKNAILKDIDEYARTHPEAVRASARPWVASVRNDYALWLARCAAR